MPLKTLSRKSISLVIGHALTGTHRRQTIKKRVGALTSFEWHIDFLFQN